MSEYLLTRSVIRTRRLGTGIAIAEEDNLEPRNEALEPYSPGERIAWAYSRFPGETVASTSFGIDSVVLLHLISRAAPGIPVVFVNTGFHFPETLEYKTRLATELGLVVREVRPLASNEAFLARHGRKFETDPNFCCWHNKVEPMERALQGVRCWITGLRRDQGPTRAQVPLLELQPNGLHKLNPIADWDHIRLADYRRQHALPEHPLAQRGYTSVGCEPCTVPPLNLSDRRSGRWAGHEKIECGIHGLGGTGAPSAEKLRPSRDGAQPLGR